MENKEEQGENAYKEASERIFAGTASLGDYKYVQNYQDWARCDWDPGFEPDLELLKEK